MALMTAAHPQIAPSLLGIQPKQSSSTDDRDNRKRALGLWRSGLQAYLQNCDVQHVAVRSLEISMCTRWTSRVRDGLVHMCT